MCPLNCSRSVEEGKEAKKQQQQKKKKKKKRAEEEEEEGAGITAGTLPINIRGRCRKSTVKVRQRQPWQFWIKLRYLRISLK